MGLETGTFISDLVATNPVGATDQRSTSDDHHRLIKAVLQNTFPNGSRAFRIPTVTSKTTGYTVVLADDNSLILGDATGGAFTVTLLSAPPTGFVLSMLKSDASANAVTIDGSGADTIDGAATMTLDRQYEAVTLMWDGTEWFRVSLKSADLVGLARTDSNFIVGDGTDFVAESGATARTSLGVAIGTDVQAQNASLTEIAAIAGVKGRILVHDGTNWNIIAVGANGTAIVADSAEVVGVKYAVVGPTAGTALVMDPIVGNTTQAQAHGLSAEPDYLKVVMECTTANKAWSIGDRIVENVNRPSGGSVGWQFDWDATNVTLRTINTGLTINLLDKDDRQSSSIALASWKLEATPYLF